MSDNISASKISSYLNCPYYYMMRYEREIPCPVNQYGKRGSDVHNILDKFFDTDLFKKKIDNPEEVFSAHMRNISGTDYYVYQEFLEGFLDIEVKRYIDLLAEGNEHHFAPIAREIKLTVDGITGVIDRVDYNPKDGFSITDYKTGLIKNVKTNWYDEFLVQLSLYCHIFERKTKIKIRKVHIYGLKQKKFTYNVKEEDITNTLNIVKEVRAKIKNEEFEINNDANCFFCPDNYKRACFKHALLELGVDEKDA